MDIGIFIDDYRKAKIDKAKADLIKKHVKATYVPYETKVAESKNILNFCCYDSDNNFRINSPLRYVLFIKVVIMLYTDLVWNAENFMIQFDLLEQYKIIEEILEEIGDDIQNFETVLAMTYDDIITNERSLLSRIESLASSAKVTFDELAKAVDDKLPELMKQLSEGE
jgi:hypothetical protein